MAYYINKVYDPNGLFRGKYDIEFQEEGHKYTVFLNMGGGRMGIGVPSVNEIINAVFGDKYSKVPADKLLAAQKKGKEIHREIREFLVNGEVGISTENLWFRYEMEKNFHNGQEGQCYCENYICADTGHNGEKFCGTIDTFWMSGLLVDYKTSYKLDKHSTKIQLNMYAYALRKELGFIVKRLEAWHFTSRGLKRVAFDIEPDYYVENIVRAYYEGRCFNNDKELMAFYAKEDGKEEKKKMENIDIVDACKRIKEVDEMMAKLKVVREKCVEKVKSEMERMDQMDMDIVGLDMNVRYVPGMVRNSLDEEKVRGFLGEEMLLKCLKQTTVKPHIRISYKKEK